MAEQTFAMPEEDASRPRLPAREATGVVLPPVPGEERTGVLPPAVPERGAPTLELPDAAEVRPEMTPEETRQELIRLSAEIRRSAAERTDRLARLAKERAERLVARAALDGELPPTMPDVAGQAEEAERVLQTTLDDIFELPEPDDLRRREEALQIERKLAAAERLTFQFADLMNELKRVSSEPVEFARVAGPAVYALSRRVENARVSGLASIEEADELLLAVETDAVKQEARAMESMVVPDFLGSAAPDQLFRLLADGAEHPRVYMEAMFNAYKAVSRGEVSNLEELVAGQLPEKLRADFQRLRTEDVPAVHQEEAHRAANLMVNRFYGEAADLLERLAASLKADEAAPEVWRVEMTASFEATVRELRAEAVAEKARYEKLQDVSRRLYEAFESDPAYAEKRAELAVRKEREAALREGKIISVRQLDNTSPVAGSYLPTRVTVEHNGQIFDVVMKVELQDRFTRAGITPGTGPLREQLGSLAAMWTGEFQAPISVARTTEEYGRVVLTEFVEGGSCQRKEDWFLNPDGSLNPDVGRIAALGFLLRRADGAPRNIIRRPDGKLLNIDWGSDFSGVAKWTEEDYSNAAHYLLDKSRQKLGADLVRQLEILRDSPTLDLLAEAVGVLPEDMDGWKEDVVARIDTILSAKDENGEAALPEYLQTYQHDFGKVFMSAARGYVLGSRDSATMVSENI
jgi:hypothetical protein